MNTNTTELTAPFIPADIVRYVEQAYYAVFEPSTQGADIANIIGPDYCSDTDYSDGGTAITVVRNHCQSESGDPVEYIFDLKLSIQSHAEYISDTSIEVTTKVSWPNVDHASFSSIHSIDELKGIPQSVYKAMSYVIKSTEMTQIEILELFSAATHSLASDCFWVIDDFTFDVESALKHDLNK